MVVFPHMHGSSQMAANWKACSTDTTLAMYAKGVLHHFTGVKAVQMLLA